MSNVDNEIDKILKEYLGMRDTYFISHKLRQTDSEHLEADLKYAQKVAKQAITTLIEQQCLKSFKNGYEQGQFDKEMDIKFYDKSWIDKSIDVLKSERMK